MASGNALLPNRGFSLLELVLAMAISTILLAASFSAYFSARQSAALTTAAGMLNDLLTEARQDAVTHNMTVEVRLYDLSSSIVGVPVYRAAQLHWLEPDGTRPAVTLPIFLPPNIAIDATAAHSTLIASNSEAVTLDSTDPLMNSQTRLFHFLADGSTDLTQGLNWFLTLRAATQSIAANFPADWACLTLDPVTGRSQILRP